MITADEYKDVLATYYIVDCAIRDRGVFGFALDRYYSDAEVAEEERNGWDMDLRPKRLAVFYRGDPVGERLGAENLGNWGGMKLGAMTTPKSQFLVYERQEQRVYVVGSGEDEFEAPLNRSHPTMGEFNIVKKIKTFNGHAYLSGSMRSFAKRISANTYESHSHLISGIPHDHPEFLRDGFDDFDMFAEDDIYAAGGKGDVWHFNGKTWRQIPLPTNAWLQTVCCGGDGNVYISGYEGLTFMGRGDSWKQIHSGGVYLGWRDMVWFEDRAWATSENGLWTIQDGRVEYVADLPSEVRVCAGNLYVADGVMLLAGMGGACFRENGQWHSIFTKGEMDRLLLDEGK